MTLATVESTLKPCFCVTMWLFQWVFLWIWPHVFHIDHTRMTIITFCPFDLTRPNVTFLVFAFICSLVQTASSTAGDLSACFTSFLGVLNLFGSTRSCRLVTQTHSTILGTSQRSLAGGKTELTLTDDEWRVWFWLFAVYSYGLNQLFASCPSPWNMHTHVAHSAQCCHLHVGSTPITWP